MQAESSPDEPRGWPISIADSWDHRKNAAQVFLKEISLSTSGTYEKSFRVKDTVIHTSWIPAAALRLKMPFK